MNEATVDTVVRNKTSQAVKEPPKYKVIYVNDDVTTVEFVVETLLEIFGYYDQEAIDKAMEINDHGFGIIAVLPYEIAEQKGIEVTMLARSNSFPLQVRIEPDL
jgi:ATP-dependent Clp protease adaptor protein ClpS